jgi:oxaloacetate decarboxylase alpha subunit
MAHRLDEALAEIPRVREELGQPIMATPFSQFVGIQAVLNIVTGRRYQLVPDEVIHYALGHYGPLHRAVDADVFDRIMAQPNAARLAEWVRPQPSLKELKSAFPADISDEEFLLRWMHSDEEVDLMLAKGPLRTDPRRSSHRIVDEMLDLLAERPRLTSMAVATPSYSMSVTRAQRCN